MSYHQNDLHIIGCCTATTSRNINTSSLVYPRRFLLIISEGGGLGLTEIGDREGKGEAEFDELSMPTTVQAI